MARLVLTYHVTRLDGWTREGADLLSLQADLAWLSRQGLPLRDLAALLAPGCRDGVAITFDDGARMEAESVEHPRLGRLPSATSLLAAAGAGADRWHAHSFVIASPRARGELADALAEDYGPELLHDRWWRGAAQSGLLAVENHSWDHNHPLVSQTAQRDNQRGGFLAIDTAAEAEAEIAAASSAIEACCGRRPRFFAYPYGEASAYLRGEWLPLHGPRLGLQAALSTEPRAIAADDDRWHLPRFVCGRDWTTDAGLEALFARWW